MQLPEHWKIKLLIVYGIWCISNRLSNYAFGSEQSDANQFSVGIKLPVELKTDTSTIGLVLKLVKFWTIRNSGDKW